MTELTQDRPTPREYALVFSRTSPGGSWPRLAAALGVGAAVVAVSSPLLPEGTRPAASHLAFMLAPLAATAACMGARQAAAPGARATWQLLVIGTILAAMGQAFYARAELLDQFVPFPSMGFHLMVAFHVAFAEAAILALRPAHQPRSGAEIALDGALLLLGASAVVLRFLLDAPLADGWLDTSQVVAILIGQLTVAASLLFVTLLVLWRDTALAGPVVDGLLLAAVFFAFGDFFLALGLEAAAGRAEVGFDFVRLAGWLVLTFTAGLATVRPRGVSATGRRELAARRFRQLIIPGAALFMAVWTVDAVQRDNVSAPSLAVISMMGVLLAARIGTALYAVEQESLDRQEAERRASLARLRAVTAQMNPHFLFNALHSLSALVRRDTGSTERALQRLGGLLRYGLDSGDELVLLRQEWSFARDYLEMESLRLGPRLTVGADMPDDILDLAVPPFIIQPLVENAVKYAISPFPNGGSISVTGRREAERLVIEITDSGEGTDEAAMLSASGVGLRAVRAQLESHFDDEWSLTSARTEEGFLVRLSLPAEEE